MHLQKHALYRYIGNLFSPPWTLKNLKRQNATHWKMLHLKEHLLFLHTMLYWMSRLEQVNSTIMSIISCPYWCFAQTCCETVLHETTLTHYNCRWLLSSFVQAAITFLYIHCQCAKMPVLTLLKLHISWWWIAVKDTVSLTMLAKLMQLGLPNLSVHASVSRQSKFFWG